MDFKISTILAGLGWLIAALWAAAAARTILLMREQPVLRPDVGRDNNGDALVSVIVPARNEADRILETSISSMIGQDYGRFEVIVVNDRSTDETGDILRMLAERDPDALQVVNGAEPPPGWLGKPHALEQGRRRSRGEWILTTDADIVFAPGAISAAVARAESGNFDALTLIPGQELGSFWERLFMPVFGWFNLLVMPPDRVNDPRRPESMGVGNFFLLRRTVLEDVGGFAGVRNDVAEDLRLAALVKSRGHSLRVEQAPDLLSTRMYAGLGEIWRGFSKNFFAGLNNSVPMAALGTLSIVLFGVLPPCFGAAALAGGAPAVVTPFFLAYVFQAAAFLLVRTRTAVFRRGTLESIGYSLLTPLGMLIFASILVNSTISILSGRGVKWKERKIYSAPER